MSVPESSLNYYPVTGHVSAQVFDRIPMEDLKDQQLYQWTLFILGFTYIKGIPIPFPNVTQPLLHDSTSFMQIGEEAKVNFSYNDKKDMYPTPSRFRGYCHHTVVTFPSWHRPYVMLIEQAIGEYAENIAQQIENANPDEKGLWADAAKQLRFPYWDWADPKVTQEGVPSLFINEDVSVHAPGKNTVTVLNPLVSFKFPYVPSDFGDNTRGNATAYFSKWKQTL
ncbi:common central domain of tyrosinase-domain-containing protein [Chiua virens]|nr:common central domain of tyrosinase-domain-containing protein [Chiua virens]